MKTTVVDHPLAAEQLTVLRDETTDRATFRRAVDNLAAMLIYEATRDLAVETTQVTTPLGPAEGVRLPRLPVVVPVLRAGLGMADAAIRLLPEAEMSFVGLARDEETFEPKSYMAKLPALRWSTRTRNSSRCRFFRSTWCRNWRARSNTFCTRSVASSATSSGRRWIAASGLWARMRTL